MNKRHGSDDHARPAGRQTAEGLLMKNGSAQFFHDENTMDISTAAHVADAIIISDIHLGSDNCQAKLVNNLLEQILDGAVETQKLIINGDIFDSIDFRRLKKTHWKVLSNIRHLSDKIAVIWIVGNHDGSAEIISQLLGVTVLDDYVLRTGGKKMFLTHGHRFDTFIDNHPVITAVGDFIYHCMQRLDRTHYVARLAKRKTKIFMRCSDKIEKQAIAAARKKHCQIASCGHTHHAKATADGDVKYFNSGCWTELPAHYLSVKDGLVTLHSVQNTPDQAELAFSRPTPSMALPDLEPEPELATV
jgi:UDP-2,3-diacylglucosamine pyrophosphatase LpxH